MSYSNYLQKFETSIRLSMADPKLTLSAWHERTIITRKALLEIKAAHDKEVSGLREIYTAKVLESRVKPLDDELREITQIAKKRALDDLERTMSEKQKQLDKCMDAPSDASLRLLNALNMRIDLSEAEITSAISKLNDNIPGLRVLKNIAEKNGFDFPDVGNLDKIERSFAEAREFATRMIESMDKTDHNDFTYSEFAFWHHPGKAEAKYYFEPLDKSFFTAAQIEDSRKRHAREKENVEKKIETGKRPNAARVFLRGDENLSGIAMQFGLSTSDIRRANPNMDLDAIGTMTPGTSIIVPSGRFTMQNTPGSIIPDQVIPAFYEPSNEADFKPGTEVNVENL